MQGGEKPPDPLCWDRTLNKGGHGSLALGALTRRALCKALSIMIQMPVLGVPAAPGAADTCRGLPARCPCSHQLHAHVGEHRVSTAPPVPRTGSASDGGGGLDGGRRGVRVVEGGETGEDGHRCREGGGSGQDGRVEEVGGSMPRRDGKGLGWGHGEGVEGQGTDVWVGRGEQGTAGRRTGASWSCQSPRGGAE